MSEHSDQVEPVNSLPEASLDNLSDRMRAAAAAAGWTQLMPVQAKAIPYVLARRDLMIQSRTGSGKTGAFMLPIIERIDAGRAVCQALVLVPTRELARQVATEAETLAGESGVRTVVVYGGVGYGPQIDGFRKGAHIVIGTPGRILDHLLQRTLTLDELEILVFDEADRMLSMGFYPDMRQVQSYLPRRRINAYMFSATYPPHVLRLAGEFLHEPEMLSLSRDHIHVAETEHIYYVAPVMEKDRAMVRIIESENPASAIIFCNTKQNVHYLATVLKRFGYDADELTADLSQNARESVMARLRKGTLRFLVATDLAGRGIDIPELSHVIMYEPPEDHEVYIHRAGRTGRAGAGGTAISIVSELEFLDLRRIAERYHIDLQKRPLPSDQDVAGLVSQRVTAMLEASLRSRDKLEIERMKRFVPLGRALADNEDESALIAMLLDDYYHQSLHGLPPQPPSAEPAKASGSKTKDDGPRRKRPRRRSSSRRQK